MSNGHYIAAIDAFLYGKGAQVSSRLLGCAGRPFIRDEPKIKVDSRIWDNLILQFPKEAR